MLTAGVVMTASAHAQTPMSPIYPTGSAKAPGTSSISKDSTRPPETGKAASPRRPSEPKEAPIATAVIPPPATAEPKKPATAEAKPEVAPELRWRSIGR